MGKRKKYSAEEKRAYWAGVGFQACENGMRSWDVQFLMTNKGQRSFINGRVKADNVGSKSIPDLFTKKVKKKK